MRSFSFNNIKWQTNKKWFLFVKTCKASLDNALIPPLPAFGWIWLRFFPPACLTSPMLDHLPKDQVIIIYQHDQAENHNPEYNEDYQVCQRGFLRRPLRLWESELSISELPDFKAPIDSKNSFAFCKFNWNPNFCLFPGIITNITKRHHNIHYLWHLSWFCPHYLHHLHNFLWPGQTVRWQESWQRQYSLRFQRLRLKPLRVMKVRETMHIKHICETLFAKTYFQHILVFSDTFEVEINGKLIFSKRQLGHYPERDEIVEITKWGNKVQTRYSLSLFNTPTRAFYVHLVHWFH